MGEIKWDDDGSNASGVVLGERRGNQLSSSREERK